MDVTKQPKRTVVIGKSAVTASIVDVIMRKKLRQEVYDKFGGLCAYSGTQLKDDWQVDHMKSKLEFEMSGEDGLNNIDNLMPVQRIVNHYKRALPLDDFRTWYLGGLHKRLAKLPKNPKSERSIRRKEYLLEVASLFEITENEPFNQVFFFETLK